jgi:ankyrin repeat protein
MEKLMPQDSAPNTNKIPSLKFLTAHAIAQAYKPAHIKKSKLPKDLKEYALTIEPHDEPLSRQLAQDILIEAVRKDQLNEDLFNDLCSINPDLDVNAADDFGPAMLHAAKAQNYNAIYFLMNRGARIDVATKDERQDTPLTLLIENLSKEQNKAQENIIQFILSQESNLVNTPNAKNETPLILSSYRNNLPVIKILLAHNAVVDCIDNHGYTPLNVAIRLVDNYSLVKLLLSHKPNLELKREHGDTAFWIAITQQSKNYEIISLLIEAGANINVQDYLGSALDYAIKTDELELAEFLLANGINPELQEENSWQKYGLALAVKESKPKFIDLLIKYGAKKTPKVLMAAIEKNDMSLLSLLAKNNPHLDDGDAQKDDNLFVKAVKEKKLNVMQLLKEAGANINIKSNFGYYGTRSALHYAVLQDQNDLLLFLLKLGCDTKATDTDHQQTPLHLAVGGNNLNAVQLLIDFGADANAKVKDDTALDMALQKSDFNMDIINLLITKTDTISSEVYHMYKFLSYLMSTDNVKLLEQLLAKGLYKKYEERLHWKNSLLNEESAKPAMRKLLLNYRPQEYYAQPWYQRAVSALLQKNMNLSEEE